MNSVVRLLKTRKKILSFHDDSSPHSTSRSNLRSIRPRDTPPPCLKAKQMPTDMARKIHQGHGRRGAYSQWLMKRLEATTQKEIMERQWSPVGEGLCGLQDARHTRSGLCGGTTGGPDSQACNDNSSETRLQVAVNQIVLSLHAPPTP